MSRNYYSEIHLHIVWHTKESQPLLSPKVEAATHAYLRQRIINTPGVYVHEIGGTETHVHIAVTIAPTIVISDFIGQLKGASSHEDSEKPRERGCKNVSLPRKACLLAGVLASFTASWLFLDLWPR